MAGSHSEGQQKGRLTIMDAQHVSHRQASHLCYLHVHQVQVTHMLCKEMTL